MSNILANSTISLKVMFRADPFAIISSLENDGVLISDNSVKDLFDFSRYLFRL